jgi:hypothetical protein
MLIRYACKHIVDDGIPDDHQPASTWSQRVKLQCPACRSSDTLRADSDHADLMRRVAQSDHGGDTYANFPARDMSPVLGMDTSPLDVSTRARTDMPGGSYAPNDVTTMRLKSMQASGQLTASAQGAIKARTPRATGPRVAEHEIRSAVARNRPYHRNPARFCQWLASIYGGRPTDYMPYMA